MATSFQNLTNAVSYNRVASQNNGSSLKNFLTNIKKFGIQTSNNFIVNFSSIPDINFMVQSISVPSFDMEMAEIYYDGQKVDVPVQSDFGHDITMTVLDDAQGYLHSVIANFILNNKYNNKMGTACVCTIKAINGDNKYPGTNFICTGARIVSLGSITLDYSGSDIVKFDVSCKCQQIVVTPGSINNINIQSIFNSQNR